MTELPDAAVVLLVMPQVSRAIRSRRYDDARAELSKAIPDLLECSRALVALIGTEPKDLLGR